MKKLANEKKWILIAIPIAIVLLCTALVLWKNSKSDSLFTLSERDILMEIGDSKKLELELGQVKMDASTLEVKWKSSKSSVATVDEKGTVEAVAGGETKVTAVVEYKGKQYSTKCMVTVKADGNQYSTYKVRWYTQKPDRTGYDIKEETFERLVGSSVEMTTQDAIKNLPENYVLNKEKSIFKGDVKKALGACVLEIYFDVAEITYTVDYYYESDTKLGTYPTRETRKYKAYAFSKVGLSEEPKTGFVINKSAKGNVLATDSVVAGSKLKVFCDRIRSKVTVSYISGKPSATYTNIYGIGLIGAPEDVFKDTAEYKLAAYVNGKKANAPADVMKTLTADAKVEVKLDGKGFEYTLVNGTSVITNNNSAKKTPSFAVLNGSSNTIYLSATYTTTGSRSNTFGITLSDGKTTRQIRFSGTGITVMKKNTTAGGIATANNATNTYANAGVYNDGDVYVWAHNTKAYKSTKASSVIQDMMRNTAGGSYNISWAVLDNILYASIDGETVLRLPLKYLDESWTGNKKYQIGFSAYDANAWGDALQISNVNLKFGNAAKALLVTDKQFDSSLAYRMGYDVFTGAYMPSSNAEAAYMYGKETSEDTGISAKIEYANINNACSAVGVSLKIGEESIQYVVEGENSSYRSMKNHTWAGINKIGTQILKEGAPVTPEGKAEVTAFVKGDYFYIMYNGVQVQCINMLSLFPEYTRDTKVSLGICTWDARYGLTKFTDVKQLSASEVKITSAGDTQSSLTLSSVSNLVMGSGITLENLNIIGKTSNGTALYANGHHLAATEEVTSPSNQMLKVYGGGNATDVTGDVNITLNSGRYRFICGAGNAAKVKGNVYLTVGGDVNDHLLGETPTWEQYDINNYFLAGGAVGANSPVWGDINVTINGNAAFRMIYGGTYATSQCNQIRITANGGYAYCLTGGGRYGVTTFKATEGYGTSEGAGAVNMTVNGGNFNYIFGAATVWPNGNSTTVTGNVNIDINGGSMNYVFGGGNMNSLTGNVTIDVTNGTIANGLYGGGFDDTATEDRCFPYVPNNKTAKAPVTGDVSVNISGGTITGPVCGGGYTQSGTANVEGTVNVNITAGTIEGIVSGGGHTTTGAANITGDVTLNTSQTTFANMVHGGGQVDGAGTANVEGNITVNVASGSYQQVFGAGYATVKDGTANVIGNVKVDVETGTFAKELFGGGYAVNGTTNVIGTVTTEIGNSDESIAVGQYNRICGSGCSTGTGVANIEKDENEQGGNATLTIYKGTFDAQVHGGGYVSSTSGSALVDGDTVVTIYGGTYNSGAVFGGGVQATNSGTATTAVAGTTHMTIENGSFGQKVFGGGYSGSGNANVGNVELLIKGGSFTASGQCINGGGFAFLHTGTARVLEQAKLTIEGGTFACPIYGAGRVQNTGKLEAAQVGNVNMTIKNGTMNNTVYGGGYRGEVAGATTVNITGGTFAQEVYGGSYQGSNTGDIALNITSGTFSKDVYGGGNADTITGDVALNIESGTFGTSIAAYGGNYAGTINGNIDMKVSSGTYSKLHGGTNVGEVTGDITMDVTNCSTKRVFGSGNNGTVGGNIYLTVGKGVNSELLEKCTSHTLYSSNHCHWMHHEDTYKLVAGGLDNSIGGSINLTVKDDAAFNYIYAGPDGAIPCDAINSVFEGGYAFSLYGGTHYGGTQFHEDSAGEINLTITGGEFYQVFGADYAPSSSANCVGDVNINILGGTIYRRVYGGSYNGDDETSHVKGDIVLSIGGGANIILDGNGHYYGDSLFDQKNDTYDGTLQGHSYAYSSTNSSFADEKVTVIFLDEQSTKYSSDVKNADTINTDYANVKSIPIGYAVDKYKENSTYPTLCEQDYVFAGWYADKECTEMVGADVTTGNYYAKFLPKEVLSVKAQLKLADGITTSSTSGTTEMRLVTTVDDCLDYRNVGFVINGKEYSSRYAYSSLQAAEFTKTPDVFSTYSKKFITRNIINLQWNTDTKLVDRPITVQAFWTTHDGMVVYGEERVITIKQGLEAIDNAESNDYSLR